MPDSSEQLISVSVEAPAPAPDETLVPDGGGTTRDGDGAAGVNPAVVAKKKRVQIAIVAALLLVITVVVTDQVTKSCSYQPDPASPTEPAPPVEPAPCYQAALRSLIAWVRDNPGLGVLAVIVVYALAAVMFIPGSIITLSVGAAFASALGLPVRTHHESQFV
jgi:hypothetical protein